MYTSNSRQACYSYNKLQISFSLQSKYISLQQLPYKMAHFRFVTSLAASADAARLVRDFTFSFPCKTSLELFLISIRSQTKVYYDLEILFSAHGVDGLCKSNQIPGAVAHIMKDAAKVWRTQCESSGTST